MGKKTIAALALLMSLLPLSCGGGGTASTASTPLVYTTSSGSVGPDYVYHETVTITGNTMEIDRTGGSSIITGDWKVTITSEEAARINELIALISPISDGDIISDTGPLGGGTSEIRLNDSLTFTNGYVYDEATSSSKFHTFSQDVRNLADYINTLLTKYGYDKKTFGS